ncbi:hypothetical protein [Nesterenkonia xinjiangensis]|uniref:Uncharacterized protein n=1 Tax=Nesterenkonia xinjiangensis TaxID=225327 RepID=A0A7Z0GJQ5_9MICC|nr:hypothetical protein [Nesterenkonia xinjiangensis]NYJ77003.1 hypothetical protein [Nesterenkonia xinjiangensis]
MLADQPGYRITYWPGREPNRVLLIGFAGANSGEAERGIGHRLAARAGYDYVFVGRAASSQYQELSLEAFVEAVAPLTEGRERVVTYGAALGGYAAVYYGGAIGAKIIAASPRNPSHPLIRTRKHRDQPFYHEEISQQPVSALAPVILSDPRREEDTRFIDELIRPAYPEGTYLDFPYTGRRVLEVLRENGLADEFIAGIVEKDKVPVVELPTEGDPTYHTERGRDLVRQGRWTEAERHLTESLRLGPTRSAIVSLARVFVQKDRAEALSDLEQEARRHQSPQWVDEQFARQRAALTVSEPAEVKDGIVVDAKPRLTEFTEPQDDFGHLRYSRGYLYTSDRSVQPSVSHWQRVEFAGGTFHWDPRSGLAVARRGDVEVLVCGHVLHTGHRTTDVGEIARALVASLAESRQAFLDDLEDMFGQYVVLDRQGSTVKAQTDASGARAMFHDSDARVLGSHVNLVGMVVGAPLSRIAKWIGDTQSFDMPGRSTEYADVWFLMPNTEVTVGTGEITRVGPRPYDPLTVDEAVERMLPQLEIQRDLLLDEDRQILLSMSAGVDTRTSLAAFSGHYDTLKTFTYSKEKRPGDSTSRMLSRDGQLAGRIAERYGLDHTVFHLDEEEATPEAFRAVLEEASPRAHMRKLAWVYHRKLPHDAIHLRSQVNGIGKWHYGHLMHHAEDHNFSAERMATLTKHGRALRRTKKPRSAFRPGIEAFQEYIDSTQLRSVPNGYLISDIFQWEHRTAYWGLAHLVESDFTFDTYSLYGSRRMIQLMLQVPEAVRAQKGLFRAIIERSEPQLVKFYVNGKKWRAPDLNIPVAEFQRGDKTYARKTELQKENAVLKKKLKQAQTEVEALRGQPTPEDEDTQTP